MPPSPNGVLIIVPHLFSLAPILSVTILQKLKCNQTPEFCYSVMPSSAEASWEEKVEVSLFNFIRQPPPPKIVSVS